MPAAGRSCNDADRVHSGSRTVIEKQLNKDGRIKYQEMDMKKGERYEIQMQTSCLSSISDALQMNHLSGSKMLCAIQSKG